VTLEELKKDWEEAYAIMKRERDMRLKVFGPNHPQRKAKVEEIDRLFAIVKGFKDALKPHCEPGYEQPPLMDIPKKAGYQ